MSEIPFVNALGDEIERRAAARIAGRGRRIRRRLTIGVLGFAVAATGVAAASGVFTAAPPDELATSGIGCYSSADPKHADVTVLGTSVKSPIEACRAMIPGDGPLVACAGPAVMVLPGGPGTCEKLGYAPLGPEYDRAQRKVLRLEGRISAIEATRDCWPPDRLAARVQTLLDEMPSWRGYRTRVAAPMGDGPCGTVTHSDGMGGRSIDAVIDTRKREVIVISIAARSTEDLLYSPRVVGLADESAERCLDDAGAEALAREAIESPEHPVTVEFEHFKGESVEPLQSRLDEGCSVIAGIGTAGDGYGIHVTIRH
jgi:hypothetical protein